MTVEISCGEAIGRSLTDAESLAMMERIVVRPPLEAWAGIVANAEVTAARLMVSAETLANWQQDGLVVTLADAGGQIMFPQAQFCESGHAAFEASPVAGLSDVLKVAVSPTSAWIWLCNPHISFGGRTPLAALFEEDLAGVLKCHHADFDAEGY